MPSSFELYPPQSVLDRITKQILIIFSNVFAVDSDRVIPEPVVAPEPVATPEPVVQPDDPYGTPHRTVDWSHHDNPDIPSTTDS